MNRNKKEFLLPLTEFSWSIDWCVLPSGHTHKEREMPEATH